MRYIIVEEHDTGGPRDRIKQYLLSQESVYGGEQLPSFTTRAEALRFIKSRDDAYRDFVILKV